MLYLAIIIAGGLGALVRFFVVRLAVNLSWTAIPYGTLLVNVIGSFLMGYLSWMLVQKWQVSKELQIIVLTAFLGGFTTFSAFSLEMVTLLEQGGNWRAVIYLLSQIVLCIGMCAFGLYLARNT